MLDTPTARRRYVDWALRLTEGTAIAPGCYERLLLEQYVAGRLSLYSAVRLSTRHRARQAVWREKCAQQAARRNTQRPVAMAANATFGPNF